MSVDNDHCDNMQLILSNFFVHRETQVSFNEDYNEEEISETIRHHKNIISNMREQNIQMARKLKVNNDIK